VVGCIGQYLKTDVIRRVPVQVKNLKASPTRDLFNKAARALLSST
jgi:hypothetical protein